MEIISITILVGSKTPHHDSISIVFNTLLEYIDTWLCLYLATKLTQDEWLICLIMYQICLICTAGA